MRRDTNSKGTSTGWSCNILWSYVWLAPILNVTQTNDYFPTLRGRHLRFANAEPPHRFSINGASAAQRLEIAHMPKIQQALEKFRFTP